MSEESDKPDAPRQTETLPFHAGSRWRGVGEPDR
jgi:hypothetical protein